MADFEPGWLGRQFDQINADIARWPAWMRRAAGLNLRPEPTMHYVLTKRVTKHNRENVTTYTVSGPFTTPKLAERAAARALGVFSCQAAQVLTRDQLLAMQAASPSDLPDHQLRLALTEAKKFLLLLSA